jgi:tetratricopeptide (TPR) repeat protein
VILNKYSPEDYLKENWLDSVILFCNKALHYDDKEARAYRLRADCYRNLGIKDKAIDDYEKALKYNPNAGDLLYNIANFCQDYDYVKSIDYFHKFYQRAAKSPSSSSAQNWSFLGGAFARAGFKEKAESNAKEALLLYDDSAMYYYDLSNYEWITCSFTKSLEYALKSFKSDSTLFTYSILNTIAWDYTMLGQLKESLIYEKRYVGKVGGQGQYFIGYLLWENGFRKEAEKYFDDFIKYCNKVISLGRRYSRNYNVYCDLAAVYAFKGDKEKAYECLRTYSKNRTIISSYTSAFIKINPFFRSIRNEPEFQQIAREIEGKYQVEHERVRKWLVENNML